MNRSDIPLFRPSRAILGGLFFALYPLQSWAETVDVTIEKYQYQPAVVRVAVGDTVRWINKERRQYHSVQLHRDASEDAVLDSRYLFPGDHWQHTFTRAGNYSYLCGPHPEMQGRVEVTE